MSGHKVGDRVDVTIRDVRITHADDGYMEAAYGPTNYILCLRTDVDAVTITRAAQQPRAGEVWEIGRLTLLIHGQADALSATDAEDSDWVRPVHAIDFTHARRVYPAPGEATPSDSKPPARGPDDDAAEATPEPAGDSLPPVCPECESRGYNCAAHMPIATIRHRCPICRAGFADDAFNTHCASTPDH